MVTRVLIDGKNDKLETHDADGNLTFSNGDFYLRNTKETLINTKLIWNESLSTPVPCDNTYTAIGNNGSSSVIAMSSDGGHPIASIDISTIGTTKATSWKSSSVCSNGTLVIAPSILEISTTTNFTGRQVFATITTDSGKAYTIFVRSRIAYKNPIQTIEYSSGDIIVRTLADYMYLIYGPTDINGLNLPPEATGYLAINEPFIITRSTTSIVSSGVLNIDWYSNPQTFNTVITS